MKFENQIKILRRVSEDPTLVYPTLNYVPMASWGWIDSLVWYKKKQKKQKTKMHLSIITWYHYVPLYFNHNTNFIILPSKHLWQHNFTLLHTHVHFLIHLCKPRILIEAPRQDSNSWLSWTTTLNHDIILLAQKVTSY